MPKDYYQVLGVDRQADAKQIKDAFRKLAQRYHPDKNPDDPTAVEKFKEVGEAYQTLSDPEAREQYDRYGHDRYQQSSRYRETASNFGAVDIMEMFAQAFGGFADFGDFMNQGGSRRRRGSDIRIQAEITLEEAFQGKTLHADIPKLRKCGPCGGSGAKPGTDPTACAHCGGRGKVVFQQGFFSVQQTCPRCAGEGCIIQSPCETCGGEGRAKANVQTKIRIPRGVNDGQTLRLNGEGNAGRRQAPPGSLLVELRVLPHETFQRDGANLYAEMSIPMTDAALGAEIPFRTIDGSEETISIPPGTQTGRAVALRGRGMPRLQKNGRGDLRVQINVETPANLSNEEKRLLQEFAQLRNESAGGGPKPKRGVFENLKNIIAGEPKDE